MAWDTYCAVCGAVTGKPYGAIRDRDDDDGTSGYDPDLLCEDDMEWLNRVRLIGYNPFSLNVDKLVKSTQSAFMVIS